MPMVPAIGIFFGRDVYESPIHIRVDRKGRNLRDARGVFFTGKLEVSETAMGLFFYFVLFVVMCFFGWSVRGTTGQ